MARKWLPNVGKAELIGFAIGYWLAKRQQATERKAQKARLNRTLQDLIRERFRAAREAGNANTEG